MSTTTPTATSATVTTASSSSPSCVTATPGKYGRVPLSACNSYYNFDPSHSAAIAFSVMFGLATLAHFIQAIVYRKGFCWVIIMGALWETISFVTRTLGARDQQNLGYATTSQLLLLLAPLWINAFVYMILGRMIWFFLPERKVFGVKAPSLATIFVGLDIISFIVQGIGVNMINPGASQSTLRIGLRIYMTGMGLQQFFIVLFLVLALTFHRRMLMLERTGRSHRRTRWKPLMFILYAVLALITMRIIFRLVEYIRGPHPSNPLPYVEAYTYCLDAAPMLFSVVLLSVIHPGMSLVGPESHFPSRKERKAAKREQREQRKAEKEVRRLGREARSDPRHHTHRSSRSGHRSSRSGRRGSRSGAAPGLH